MQPPLVGATYLVVAMRFVRKVNDRGVLTLPSEVREALDVADGDIVEFEILRIVKKGKVSLEATPAPTTPPTPAEGQP
ncbi:MAG: AbrB/MazE/SpoVT family DNA-binding domain-containing protein [Candidatus Thermoplasmatota archaeon]